MAATRRDSLKLLLTAVGAGAAPLALVENSFAAAGSAPRFYTEDELALVIRLCDLLLPDTDTPGAVSAGVPVLLDALMVEWASAATRAEHRGQLSSCATALGADGSAFASLPPDAATARLGSFDEAAYGKDDANDGSRAWRSLKTLITRAYFATEPGARQELDWRLVPGRWVPCQELPA